MPHSYGYKPDHHDYRDLMFTPDTTNVDYLPRRVDLRDDSFMPEIWNQGELGSCVWHGVPAAFLFCANRSGANDPMLSRLYGYYYTRSVEGTINEDSGCEIRDAIKVATQGLPPETDWPYDITKFEVQPPDIATKDASENIAITYESVPLTQGHVMAALADNSIVVDGMPVYESMESQDVARTGFVPLPSVGESLLGGHCTAKVGYDLDLDPWDGAYPPGVWITRNSWGTGWGMDGYFYTPLLQVKTNSDAWRILKAS